MGDNLLTIQAEGHYERCDYQTHPDLMTSWINNMAKEWPTIKEKIMDRRFNQPVEENEARTNPYNAVMDVFEGLSLDFQGSHFTASNYLFRLTPLYTLVKIDDCHSQLEAI